MIKLNRRKRIYLAASFRRQEEMKRVREVLSEYNYEVFGSWLDEDPTLDGRLTLDQKRKVGDKCIYEILRASIVAVFIDDSKTDNGRGGYQVEFGYALAKGKVLVSVGSAERNVFHEQYRVLKYRSIEDFLQAARTWKNFLPRPI